MGPFVRREMVTRRLLAQYVCIRWTNLFRFAQSFIGTNSVLRSKVYLRTIRLNTDAYLRGE